MTRKHEVRRFVPLFLSAGLAACIAFACHAGQLDSPSASKPTILRGDSQMAITPQEPWVLVRSVAADDAALTGTTKAWGQIQGSLKALRPWSTVTLSFLAYGDGDGAGDPGSGSFDYEVYACRWQGSLELVCSGSVTIGDVEASVLPHDDQGTALTTPANYKWAEGGATLVTSQSWDAAVGCTKTANQVGKVSWDPLGSPYVFVRISNITSVTTVYALITGR